MDLKVPVGVSNKHVHISREDLDILFGEGYELTNMKDLSQPGQYAAEERVEVVGNRSSMVMRILGPVRKNTQVEISISDSFSLGVEGILRESGNIEGTPGLTIKGPKGQVELDKGVIVAARHIHFDPDDAKKFGVTNGQKVQVKTEGPRSITFDEVICRVDPSFALDMHIDMDEANAAGIKNGDQVRVIV
ncbi:MAG: phosphate propanoyltransferase [Tissierellia bacterium]|nr:phosphate propanoyltransferase [Tissierellia bacterium]